MSTSPSNQPSLEQILARLETMTATAFAAKGLAAGDKAVQAVPPAACFAKSDLVQTPTEADVIKSQDWEMENLPARTFMQVASQKAQEAVASIGDAFTNAKNKLMSTATRVKDWTVAKANDLKEGVVSGFKALKEISTLLGKDEKSDLKEKYPKIHKCVAAFEGFCKAVGKKFTQAKDAVGKFAAKFGPKKGSYKLENPEQTRDRGQSFVDRMERGRAGSATSQSKS